MDKIILSSGLSFIITFFSIPVIIQVAKDKKLFDEPDERKVHKTVIPTLGGLGIFAGFMVALLMGVPAISNSPLQYILAAIVVVFFLGLKDDILILSATKKFAGQVLAAGILIKFGGFRIDNMHGFMGIQEIPHLASIVLTLLIIIMITNSFNLIDGVDGLAGSLGVLSTLAFGSYFYFTDQLLYAVIAFSFAGGLSSFLIYNFSPAKIFMGDTGSLLLGLVNSILVIQFINTADSSAVPFRINAGPAIGFAVLMVPLFDTLRVFGLRILNRRSPFSPDRNHIHHFLLDAGFSHRKVSLTCTVINLLVLLIAICARDLGTNYLIILLFAIGFIYTFAIFKYRQQVIQKRKFTKAQNESLVTGSAHQLFKMSAEAVDVSD